MHIFGCEPKRTKVCFLNGHLLFDILISIACLLLAARLAKILDTQDIDLDDIPANFFPVYSTLSMRTANQLMTHLPHLCTVSILRKGLRLKDYQSDKLLHLYLFCHTDKQLMGH